MDLSTFIIAILASTSTFICTWLWLRKKPANDQLRSTKSFQSLPIGMVVTDPNLPNHPIVFCNDEFTQLTGYSREDVIGKNCGFLHQQDSDQPGIGVLSQAIKQKSEATVTLRNYRRDGRLFWNKISITPVFDEAHKCTHFVGIQQDITHSGSNTTDLIAKNQRLSAIQSTLLELTQHNAPSFELLLEKYIAISAANLGTTRVGLWQVNEVSNTMGCTLMLHNGELVTENWTVPIGDRPAYFEVLQRNQLAIIDDTSIATDQFDLSLEYFISRNIGAILDAPITINGRVIAVISHEHTNGPRQWNEDEQQFATVIADLCGVAFVSEENRIASNQLKTTEALLTEAQQIARLGSFIWHPKNDEFILSNQHLDSMVDTRSINNLEAFATFVTEPARGQFLSDMRLIAEHKASNNKQVYPFSFEPDAPCYLEINAEFHVSSLNPNQSVQGVRGTIQDVTTRTLAEQETKKLQARLVEAEKLETIGTLAGGVAHDFNNLLTPVIGFAEILTNDFDEDDPRRNYSKQITSSGLRAKSLVEQLLIFSHHEQVDHESIDLAFTCTHSIETIQNIVSSNIRLHALPSTQLVVAADPKQIHQVLLNLSQNADTAMQGNGIIYITLSVEENEGAQSGQRNNSRYAVISVTDSGTGIEPVVKPHVFEPFFTTHEIGQGPGLGLSVVHGIAQQHNGHIEIQSEPGKTIFKFYLPLLPTNDTTT